MRRWQKAGIWIATGAYVLLLTTVSVLPSGDDAPGGWDRHLAPRTQNILHVPAYTVLAVLATSCVWLVARPALAGAAWTAVGCSVFGGLLEWAQTAVPGRMGSVADALLNLAGAAVGLLILAVGRRFFPTAPSGARHTP